VLFALIAATLSVSIFALSTVAPLVSLAPDGMTDSRPWLINAA
jgi:hypothetical protein